MIVLFILCECNHNKGTLGQPPACIMDPWAGAAWDLLAPANVPYPWPEGNTSRVEEEFITHCWCSHWPVQTGGTVNASGEWLVLWYRCLPTAEWVELPTCHRLSNRYSLQSWSFWTRLEIVISNALETYFLWALVLHNLSLCLSGRWSGPMSSTIELVNEWNQNVRPGSGQIYFLLCSCKGPYLLFLKIFFRIFKLFFAGVFYQLLDGAV